MLAILVSVLICICELVSMCQWVGKCIDACKYVVDRVYLCQGVLGLDVQCICIRVSVGVVVCMWLCVCVWVSLYFPLYVIYVLDCDPICDIVCV